MNVIKYLWDREEGNPWHDYKSHCVEPAAKIKFRFDGRKDHVR